jgi:hypothetical protein
MRVLTLVAVVAVVALAGCSAVPATDSRPTASEPATAPGDLTDPEEDVLGWEGGYWYNESLPVTADDGLNETEREMVVNRSMARVERVRGLEFDEPVDVDVISRTTYREEYAGSGNTSEALRTFDDAKFEALFLVGEDRDAIDVQRSNRGSNVLGFYSSSEDRIVVVSPTETPQIRETTLGHELVHALQFRQLGAGYDSPTRDRANANSGLIEGDARFVDQQYGDRCGTDWDCVTAGGGGGGGDLHLGVYMLKYFPYSDGPGFVESFHEDGGWTTVGDLYGDPPASSEQVAQPEKYGEGDPSDPTLRDRSSGEWSRVSVDGRAPYAEVGVGGLTAMLAYPAYDDSRQGAVLSPRAFLNYEDGQVNSRDPFDYATAPVEGWDGERMWVYEHDDGDLGYTWRIAWDSPRDATEFAESYRDLLRYWGGERADGDGVWRIPEDESPFADAFRVTVEDDRVTIVNAPSTDELDDVHAPRN